MRKLLISACLLLFVFTASQAQHTFELNVNYGVAGNFQLDYEQPQSEVPGGFVSFYNKNFLGSIGGIEFQWNIKDSKASIGVSYDRESHIGEKNYSQLIGNDTYLEIIDFKLRHINEMYSVFYKRRLSEKLLLTGGAFFVNPKMQEIEYFTNAFINSTQTIATLVSIQERNGSNSNLVDAGLFIGAEYYFYKSGKFQVGIQSRLFHTTSLGSFETITLTPKLRYTF